MSKGTRDAWRTAHLLVRCYPPAWQARYGDELHALLDDLGAGPRTTASIALGAARAWLCPDRHLLDGPGRMRASVAVALSGWTVLAGLALIFGQVTEGLHVAALTPGHGATAAWDRLYLVAAFASVVIAVGCGLPLWSVMLRTACRQRSRRDLVLLTLPLTIPVAFLAVLLGVTWLVARHAGFGQSLFLVMCVVGLAAGAGGAAGPGIALRRLRPAGRQLRLAAFGAAAAAATMAIAGLASVLTAGCLAAWNPSHYGLRYYGWQLALYLAAIVAASCVALTSSVRGLPAARPQS
jgi:hypothetical protein